MIDAFTIMVDSFDRVAQELPRIVAGLTEDELVWSPAPGANPIGWIVWHIGRVEDAQVAALARREPVYAARGFAERLALPYRRSSVGYGQTAQEVARFRVADPTVLIDYYTAVHEATLSALAAMTEADLDRVTDDPFAVSYATRLVSIINDVTQHLGQAAYLRGLLRT